MDKHLCGDLTLIFGDDIQVENGLRRYNWYQSLGLRDSGIHESMVTTRMGSSGTTEEGDHKIPDLRGIIASQMGEILHEILPGLFDQMKREMREIVTHQIRSSSGGRVNEAGSSQSGHPRNVTFKDFMACQPPNFQGEKDPVVSSRWISEVEGAFLTSFSPAEVKIAAMTWEEFKELFKAEFEPQVQIERLINEFLYMKQTTDSARSPKRFWRSLMFERARAREIELERQGKRKKEEHSQVQPNKKFKGTGQRSEGKKEYPKCSKYGRNHPGECRLAASTQVSGVEPLKAIEASLAKKVEIPKGRARVFQLTAEEAKVEPEVVTGIFPVNSKPALVLFDTDASKSFVSTYFCKGFSNVNGRLDEPLEVEIADEKSVIVRDVYKGNVIELEGVRFRVDLIPIPMREINVVLGMSWLSRHGAWFDCDGQRVKIKNPSGGDLIITGDGMKRPPKTCSLAKARRYVKGGGVSYLVYVTEVAGEKKKKTVADVPVVRDFPDVFSKYLPGVPPEQQVEFGIDQIPGAAPVAKSPYRLPPPKMQELSRSHLVLEDRSSIWVPSSKSERRGRVEDRVQNEGKEQQKAFELLREKLCEAPVLTLPEGIEDMTVYCDASYHRLGCVLMQRGKVIAYARESGEPKERERIKGQLAKLVTDSRGLLTRSGRVWVPESCEARQTLLDEAHKSKFSIHPGATKMYRDLRVKAEHLRPHGKLQPLDIPIWKWEHITMDLITKLPHTPRNVDAIWVIVDRLTKSAHFIAINESSSLEKLADIYVKEVVARHGVPVTVISDRDVRFTSWFWARFHEDLGTRLQFSTAFHPQTDGQSERTI
ncbi:hypothetical protein OSB04_020258 [Centaurea solstitialis]|uniref:Integrase catalytic domain-containing protein n=1 Tax=Centaurea solstitialis TaxID=347529 RepID=A0AA38WD40_9ASTR|nr:hypothetical protein OSB04_020258 [Centaurea solstitialis]